MDLSTGTITPVTHEDVEVIQARIDAMHSDGPALLSADAADRLRAMTPERRRHIGANIRRQRVKRKARNRRRRKLGRK